MCITNSQSLFRLMSIGSVLFSRIKQIKTALEPKYLWRDERHSSGDHRHSFIYSLLWQIFVGCLLRGTCCVLGFLGDIREPVFCVCLVVRITPWLCVHFRTFEYREEPQSVWPFHQQFERSLGPRWGQSSPVQALLCTHSRGARGTGNYFL